MTDEQKVEERKAIRLAEEKALDRLKFSARSVAEGATWWTKEKQWSFMERALTGLISEAAEYRHVCKVNQEREGRNDVVIPDPPNPQLFLYPNKEMVEIK